jgi:predicted secreted protein
MAALSRAKTEPSVRKRSLLQWLNLPAIGSRLQENQVSEHTSAMAQGLLALTLVLLLALSGCGPGEKVVVTDDDDGASLEVPRGGWLYVELDANPESNFLWVIDHLDQNILEFDSKRLVTTAEKNKFGGYVHREFRFKGKRSGETRLVLQFISTDDDDAVASDEYRLRVKVVE